MLCCETDELICFCVIFFVVKCGMILLFVILFAGCISKDTSSVECWLNSDCVVLLLCMVGWCFFECCEDVDCEVIYICVDDRCCLKILVVCVCVLVDDCMIGEICYGGLCVPV